VDCVLTAIALQSSWRGNLALQGSRLKLIMVIWWIAPNYRLGHDSHKCAQLKIGENEKSLSLFSSLFPFTQMLLQSLFIYLCLTFFFIIHFFLSWTLLLSSFLSFFFAWYTLIYVFFSVTWSLPWIRLTPLLRMSLHRKYVVFQSNDKSLLCVNICTCISFVLLLF